MSSEAEPSSLVLVRLSADGTVEWIPLESPAQHVAVVADDAYTLIDRANYEAPQTLVVERVGKDLVVEVQGKEALVLDGFFTTARVEFYPTTHVAGGAGLFSGPALTADSLAVADYSTGKLVLWSVEEGEPAEPDALGADSTAVVAGPQVSSGGSSPLLWAGLAAGGLGLAALAGGGGGSGGGESGSSGGAGTPPADTTAPQITSSAIAPAIAENSGAGQVVYTTTATDASTVTYSLNASGDTDAFSINANTGAVTLNANPNFETKPSYSFTVVATDVAGNHSERAVSLAINNVDEVAPTITSGATASPIAENSGPNQIVYTVTSTDTADVSSGNTTYSLKPVGDSAAFAINADTGAVSLIGNPDFETKSSYNFTVVATDAAHNSSERAVLLVIVDTIDTIPLPDLIPPTLSGSTPANDARDIPVDQNIVLVFSENVTIGSGTITLRDRGDNLTIDVNDVTQVSVNGNQVTINPAVDLNFDGNYDVRIGPGALTDLAGNPFAGGSALHFRTADEDNLVSAALDGGRAFQDANPEVEIRSGTLTAATDDAAIWSGSANLGSDTRVMLVGKGADVSDPSAPPNPMSIMEAAIAWQSEPNGIIEGNLHEASPPVAHGSVETHVDIAHLPVAMATSQGLV